MSDILEAISLCCEKGKVNRDAPYPPAMKGQDGVDELVRQALDSGIDPTAVLNDALMVGMERIGKKFGNNEAFVPDLLMAARAMQTGLRHLQPYFDAGVTKRRGVFVIGTVQGDLHDIGKNLVRMVIEGGGWEVVDLGVDVSAQKYLEAIAAHPGCAVGMSALLTTTMVNMGKLVTSIRERFPETFILVGGAPVTQDYCEKIGANAYAPDPQSALERLNAAA